VQFDISWRIFLPFSSRSALSILFREFLGPDETTEEEKEEELNHEIEETRKISPVSFKSSSVHRGNFFDRNTR